MPECWKLTGPPDDDYHLWCELNPCPSCHGEAEGYHEDEWNCTTGGYGVPWVCSYCPKALASTLTPPTAMPSQSTESSDAQANNYDRSRRAERV